MDIGLDIAKAIAPRDGIGHFTLQLVRALAEELCARGEDELFLYAPGRPGDVERIREELPGLPECVHPRSGPPRDDGLDVYHSTGWTVPPLLGVPLVFTCYDLTILSHPRCHTLDNRIHCLTGVLEAHLAGAAFLTISHASAGELEERLGVDPARVRVIYPAPAPEFRRLPEAETSERLARTLSVAGPYVLAVGTLEPRKNLETLARAYRALPAEVRRELPLLAAGGPGWGVAGADAGEAVRQLGYVGRDDLVALYNGATVFAYPSLAEGFGLPVAEAMACGAPVLTSDRSSLPEVAGGAARLVDPTDADAIRAGLLALIEAPAERQRLRRLGLERARAFSWRESAGKTLELYREAAERR